MSLKSLLEHSSKRKFKLTIETVDEEKEKLVVLAEVRLGDDYRSLDLHLEAVEGLEE